MAFDDIKTLTLDRWLAVINPNERIFGIYLLSAAVLAFLSWLYYRKLEKDLHPEEADRSFLAYIFDPKIYFHKSAMQDYLYFLVNGVIYVGIISQLLISTHFFTAMFQGGLENMFGTHDAPLMKSSALTIAAYTACYVLLLDFAVFFVHYLLHKIPALWEFHKVHHSAEVLTPITLYRMHPVDLFLTSLLAAILVSFAYAGFYYLTGEEPAAYEIMGMNIIIFAFYLIGYNLRHSHIWLNYPGWLSTLLISPAQHQIHHSIDPKHFDKNMGLIFSFWDKWFKTLYVPKKYERISYGISKQEPNPYNSVWQMYYKPFVDAWNVIHKSKKTKAALGIFVLICIFTAFMYTVFLALDRTMQVQKAPPVSVHMEELSWTEIQRGMDIFDYDTVIIPTGGTEQNGAHVVLGKHNVIMRKNAETIATKLGGTFVAPVLAYVPEEVHMDYAGTVSLPETVFEDVLTAAAESYIRHGFKNILFIGESQGNQEGQEKVAKTLSKKYSKDALIISNIGDYYSANGQMEWLMKQGYTKNQIGGHVGIRDTSEILYLYPEGLKRDPFYIEGRDTGHNGDYKQASKKIGKIMTDLKIEAAMKQIRSIIGKEEIQGTDKDTNLKSKINITP